jgi:hypothetical protein
MASDGVRPPGDAGAELARLDFPVGSARVFLYVFFGVLAALLAFWFFRVMSAPVFPGTSRGPFLVIFAVFAAIVGLGFLVALLLLRRRPTAMVVAENALVLHYGSRPVTVGWPAVSGLDQHLLRGLPTHVVFLAGGGQVAFGVGAKAQELARHIARQAGLTWIDEPFIARRKS